MQYVGFFGVSLINNGKAIDDDIRDHNQKALNKMMYKLRGESDDAEDFFLNVGFTLSGFVLRHPGFWFDMDMVNRAINNYMDETGEFKRIDPPIDGRVVVNVFNTLGNNIKQMQVFAELSSKKPVEN